MYTLYGYGKIANKDVQCHVVDYSLVLLIHAGELSNTNTYQVRRMKR